MARLVISTGGGLIKNTSYYLRRLQGLATPQPMTSFGRTIKCVRFQGRSLQIGVASSCQARRKFSVYSSAPSPPPNSGNSSLGKWILGIMMTVIVPFLTNKWTKLLQIKDEVKTMVEETEQVIERVEEVAEAVDKVTKDVVDYLPKDGKLRNAVVLVEDVAEEIFKDVHFAEKIINKVEKVEEKVDFIVEQVNNNKAKDDI